MRIVAGEYRGRRLETPKSDDIRPTSDKVRQAVFNMLLSRDLIDEAIVIDTFCGTGALGIEAISQGAASCLFIDKDRASLDLCRRNLMTLGIPKDQYQCLLKDASKIMQKPENTALATLVFLDPPYRKNLVSPTVVTLQNGGWVSAGATYVIETAKDEKLILPGLTVEQEKIYGDTKVTLGYIAPE